MRLSNFLSISQNVRIAADQANILMYIDSRMYLLLVWCSDGTIVVWDTYVLTSYIQVMQYWTKIPVCCSANKISHFNIMVFAKESNIFWYIHKQVHTHFITLVKLYNVYYYMLITIQWICKMDLIITLAIFLCKSSTKV